MEGRQATIIAHLLHEETEAARAILDDSNITQPWEHQVGSCLTAMCTAPGTASQQISAIIDQFLAHEPVDGYAVYRARWGLTAATLSSGHHEAAAQHLLHHVATEALEAADGYAAREILGHRTALQIREPQEQALAHIVAAAGLGAGAIPETTLRTLNGAVEIARDALARSVEALKGLATPRKRSRVRELGEPAPEIVPMIEVPVAGVRAALARGSDQLGNLGWRGA